MGAKFSARAYMQNAAAALGALAEQADTIHRIGDRIVQILRGGGKIMTCGNGGSAAEAMHLAEELIGRYRAARRPMAAMALNADPTAMTCIANDWSFAEVFARQVEGLGRPGDGLVVLTTSGRSPNILRALEVARNAGITTIGLLGPAGSDAQALCELALLQDGPASSHVQEGHLATIHAVLEMVDESLG